MSLTASWVVAAVAVTLAACAPPSIPLGTGSGSNSGTASEAAAEIAREIDDYYSKASDDLLRSDPARFFQVGMEELADVREAQKQWRNSTSDIEFPDVSRKGMPSRSAVDEFNASMDAWLGTSID